MENLEILDLLEKHAQDLRNSIAGKPAAAAQQLENTRYEMLRNFYLQQEDSDFTFDFASEVKKK